MAGRKVRRLFVAIRVWISGCAAAIWCCCLAHSSWQMPPRGAWLEDMNDGVGKKFKHIAYARTGWLYVGLRANNLS